MTPEFTIKIFEYGITVDGDGEIEISTSGGYHGEEVERYFTIKELRAIASHAEAHQTAYQAFKDSDYEDEEAYHKYMSDFLDENKEV